MAISLSDLTTLTSCSATTGFTAISNGAGLALSSGFGNAGYIPQEGTECLQWEVTQANTPSVTPDGYRYDLPTGSIDITQFAISQWMLLAPTNLAKAPLLQSVTGALRVRVFSSQSGVERWADYYFGGSDPQNNTEKGWINLTVSGDAGTEDGNSGTWLTADAQAVDAVGILVLAANGNEGKNDPPYGMDWLRYYRTIEVDGYNGGTTPWTFQDIYDQDQENLGVDGDGVWGIVRKNDIFYEIAAAVDFGNGVTAGAFADANKYGYFKTSSDDANAEITIANNFTVTLGTKDDNGPSGTVYAVAGVPMVAGNGAPNITVASGGIFNNYGGILRGWGTINLGSGGTSQIEFVKVDIDDNVTLELRSTGLDFNNVRMHLPPGQAAAIGAVYNTPVLQDIVVFLVTNGMEFRTNCLVRRYTARDTTYDIVILEGVTNLQMVDSSVRTNKLLRVTV